MRNLSFSMALLACLLLTPLPADCAPPSAAQAPSLDALEKELTTITEELTRVEERIDALLQELIDPRLTSLSVFFAVQGLEGKVPMSLEILVDGNPLATRAFTEVDRLILIRGGSIEVYGGVADPVKQSLTVQYALAPSEGTRGTETSGRGVFNLEPRRGTANFLEVTLTPDPARKPGQLALNARFWSKEP